LDKNCEEEIIVAFLKAIVRKKYRWIRFMTLEISKHQEAYHAIKNLIAEHKLIPGQKLILRDLEETLRMSKTPIINSLIMLEQEGLVESKANRGFFMKEVSVEMAEQIYDLREKLEAISVDYAIANHEPADLAILRDKLESYKNYEAPVYDRQRMQYDTDFHLQIAIIGKNAFFTDMVKQFYENIYFTLNVVYLTPYVVNFKAEHDIVFEAIKNKDLKTAKKALAAHTRAARKLLVAALK
jgi:DNA-binding GntR family transcriptional regulator